MPAIRGPIPSLSPFCCPVTGRGAESFPGRGDLPLRSLFADQLPGFDFSRDGREEGMGLRLVDDPKGL
jgi:hypothetical protein